MILMPSPQSYRRRIFSPERESLRWWYETMVLNMLARNLRSFQRVGTFITIPHHHTIQKETVQRKLQSNKLRGYSRWVTTPGWLFWNKGIHLMSWHHQMRNWTPEEQEELYQWNQSYFNPTWYQPQASYELQSRRSDRTRGTMIRKQSRYPLLLWEIV